MSDKIVDYSRPSADYSAPAFERERVALQHRFATLAGGGHITQEKVLRMICTVPGYLYFSEAPMTDGYVPMVTLYVKTRYGKVAVVFPKCNDLAENDGTITDRSVSIHSFKAVAAYEVITLCGNLLRAMPMPLKPREPDAGDDQWEPCGFAGRAGAT